MTIDEDVTRFTCGDCKHWWKRCKCIDHNIIHFARPYFSCDQYTSSHCICSSFDCVSYYPALREEWESYSNFWDWHEKFISQWYNGKKPKSISLIRTHSINKDREVFDDVWEVPYEDFLNCDIIKKDGIHYSNYRHIERTRKNPVGYVWINEGAGILSLEELNGKQQD